MLLLFLKKIAVYRVNLISFFLLWFTRNYNNILSKIKLSKNFIWCLQMYKNFISVFLGIQNIQKLKNGATNIDLSSRTDVVVKKYLRLARKFFKHELNHQTNLWEQNINGILTQ